MRQPKSSPAADAQFSAGAIAFDRSDVAGAASYTIQIDDTQSFTAPLTVNQTVGVPQLTTCTLPTIRMGGACAPTMLPARSVPGPRPGDSR